MNKTIIGDCRESMRQMISDGVKVQTCVTSPPYWGLRDYKVEGQMGLESTLAEYITNMIEVFSMVWGLLEDDGTLWLNLGDAYAGSGKGSATHPGTNEKWKQGTSKGTHNKTIHNHIPIGLKPKDLMGLPWRVAFALQEFGWYLRTDIVWAKPNPMPESVTDRPTRSHEFIFLLTKSKKYYYDTDAIKEPGIYDVDGTGTKSRKSRARVDQKNMPDKIKNGIRPAGFKNATKFNGKHSDKQRGHSQRHAGFNARWDQMTTAEQSSGYRNKRDVWTVATCPYPDAHFATFPPKLIEPCILAGSRAGDIVFDPFMGSGTTAQVAQDLGRQWLGCELNPAYEPMQLERTRQMALAI